MAPSRKRSEDDILDAARECVEAFGVRRTTLSDVARRAGVSRPTVYRYWPDINALVGDLLTRELRAIFAEAVAGASGQAALQRIVQGCVGTVRAIWHHSLFNKFVDHEPERLSVYVFHRLGASQHAALDLLFGEIANGQADGSVRQGDPAQLARVTLVLAQSFGASRRLLEDVLDEEAQLETLTTTLLGHLQTPKETS